MTGSGNRKDFRNFFYRKLRDRKKYLWYDTDIQKLTNKKVFAVYK